MSLEGPELEEFIRSTEHSHDTEDAVLHRMKNPIYGFTGGANNLCWFYSSLQLLLNTHAYRQWISKEVSTKRTKCEMLHHIFKEFIHKQEIYPLKEDVRVIDVGGFIAGIKSVPENLQFLFYTILTTGEQQDPLQMLDEISECLNINSFQVNYKTIFYDERKKTLTYLPLLHNPRPETVLANFSSSVPKASFVFNSTQLINNNSTTFTSLQQLIDIIPVFPIKENSTSTLDTHFISSLKTSSLSRYLEIKQNIKDLSGKKKSFNIYDYFEVLDAAFTTLFNLTGKGFSYDSTVIDWFNDKVSKNILRTYVDKDNTTRYEFVNNIKNSIKDYINTNNIRTYDAFLTGLKSSSEQNVKNLHNVLEFYEDVVLKPILQNMYDDFTTYVPDTNIVIIQPSVTRNVIHKSIMQTQRFNHLSRIDFTTIRPEHVFNFNGKKYFLICIVWQTSEGIGEAGHYQVEINIVNPKDKSIQPGLYHCNDSSTKK